jgi:alpha-D-ribose 1-methylphosphonate 5-triphosphate synthase subunit PhnG
MLQSVDIPPETSTRERADWLSVLARAPLELLEAQLGSMASRASNNEQWLRAPETGLMMVQGRVGGSGEPFNLGEVSVTRCALRLGDRATGAATVGVGYVMGRSHRRAHLAALADALMQHEVERASLEINLLSPARAYHARLNAERRARAESTNVDFFTVSREADQSGVDAQAAA